MRNCACVSRCSLALCRSSFSRVGSSLLYTACNLLKHNDDRDLVTKYLGGLDEMLCLATMNMIENGTQESVR